jgi:sigma-B regulation protein RsbU (phosphoserine phosphatase)
MLQGALSSLAIGTEPGLVIGHLNRFLCSHAEVGRYATLFFGVLDRDGNLEYIKAGHPSPLLLGGGEVKELSPGGSFPVGLLPIAEYESAHATLKPGDTLVMFSDGVTEAADPSEEMYGDDRLRQAVTGSDALPLGDIQRAVLDSVEQFVRGAHQADDITLLLVRYRPGAAPR